MRQRAFTLVELLVVMSVIAIIATLTFYVTLRVRRSAALTREVNGARELIAAYLRSAADRGGELMVGYSAHESATDELGEEVANPACGRYPWRLAPYMEYRMRGVLVVNEQESVLDGRDREDLVYRISAHPSFGINATYVGGNERTGLMPTPATINRFGDFVVRTIGQVAQPSRQLVFASSHFSNGGPPGESYPADEQPGFHLLTPPRTARIEWRGPYDPKKPADQFGFLHLRHDGRAVCAMLGGQVEMLGETDLLDMRYWNPQAAEADDPEFLLKPIRRPTK